MSPRRRKWLIAGPSVFTVVWLLPEPWLGLGGEARAVLAVALWMAVWWGAEAVPLAVTALLPLALFPLLGVLEASAAAAPYADQIIFLFLGGFLLAGAVESSGLHRRIALRLVAVMGDDPRLIIGGFMVAAALLSMWISNSATAIMLLPVATAVSRRLVVADEGAPPKPFEKALLLGIAYAASVGGVGTLIGTPPNLVLAAAAEELLDRPIDFAQWLAVGVPLVVVLLPLAWLYLTRVAFKVGATRVKGVQALVRGELAKLGTSSPAERLVLLVFVCTALGWVFRSTKEIGGVVIPGLDTLWPAIKDSTIAIVAAISLFVLPGGRLGAPPVLTWEEAKRVPWDVILLFGGGLCLAKAFQASGLDEVIASGLASGSGSSSFVVVAAVVAGTVALTEFTSNTATAAMLMPLLAAAAVAGGQDPLGLMIAGAVACSFAFCLPVATPPNAVVYGSGRLAMRDMILAGLAMNAVAYVVWLALFFLIAGPILGLGTTVSGP